MTTATEAAASLRAVLAAIDAAEIHASGLERAYLTGAADALERIADQRSRQATLRSGCVTGK